VNARLDEFTEAKIRRAQNDPGFVSTRLGEIEREWDIDRAIMLGFAAMGTIALALGLRRNARWRFPLAGQIGFLLAHAFVGWCPPASVLRRLGFRTRQEIEAERTVLLSSARRSNFALPKPA
jgi:hypothetical protein